MNFKDYVYSMESPWVWAVMLLISLRAIYKCAMTKDYPHLAAFVVVFVGSLYMLGVVNGLFPVPDFLK